MPNRQTLRDVFQQAASGEKPRQPHADGPELLLEAEYAAKVLNALATKIAKHLGGTYHRGPAKDLGRVYAKAQMRGYDPSHNHDYARGCIPLRNNDQIRKAIDLFHAPGPITLPDGEVLHVLDVDNSFVRENPKKPGLRNLDLKIALPITLEDGSESYHIAELQFRRKGTEKAYAQSHEIYKEARRTLLLRQFIENKMDMNGDPATLRSLERHWLEQATAYDRLMQTRKTMNLAVARKLGLDELLGYQPCVSRNAQIVAPGLK